MAQAKTCDPSALDFEMPARRLGREVQPTRNRALEPNLFQRVCCFVEPLVRQEAHNAYFGETELESTDPAPSPRALVAVTVKR